MSPRVGRSGARLPLETLAYVFFHRPRRGVRTDEYTRALVRFHSKLARTRPSGFRESTAVRCPQAPWKEPRARAIYLDWYVVDGFPALDPIREVAYVPPWVGAHRAIARLAAQGWGSLYSTPGKARAPGPTVGFTWFSASGRTREWLRRALRSPPAHGTLWRRQLALGPGPEFCWVEEGRPPAALSETGVDPTVETLFPRPGSGRRAPRGRVKP
jgi:hypothetical protein